jgi:hypothetical protein
VKAAAADPWSAFARAIEATGAALLANVRDPRERADGAAYLAGLAAVALEQQTTGADPARPRFVANPRPSAKWGAENADNTYRWAPLRPDLRYRVSGRRGTSFELLFETKDGFMQLGQARNFAARAASELRCGDGGDFELWLGGDARDGNWMPIDPAARWLLVREYFVDWERETPAQLAIECLDDVAPAPIDVAAQLAAAARWIDGTARFWASWVADLRAAHQPDRLAPARRYEGGADAILYGNDWFRVDDGEALLVTCDVPDARYWSFQLCDPWFRSLDYANHVASLNCAQARRDADGRVRIAVAARDPGVPNWLDTTGLREGVFQYRFVWARSAPQPAVERVALDAVSARLPAATPRVTPAERRAACAARRRHVALRTG